MGFVARHIKWIMLVSGALTCTMVHAAIAPQAALRYTFGETLEGPLAEIVVRNWGVLITLVGAMLMYGAINPQVRTFVLAIAGGLAYSFGKHRFETAGPLDREKIVNIPRGLGLREIADLLARENVIDQPWVFIGGVLVLSPEIARYESSKNRVLLS